MRFQKRLLSRIPFLICFVVMLGALTSVASASVERHISWETCSSCGVSRSILLECIDGSCLDGHFTRRYTCLTCSYVWTRSIDVSSFQHKMQSDSKYDHEATCVKDCEAFFYCRVCYYEEFRPVSGTALGHEWVETGRMEPTITLEGTITYECSSCGETKSESIPMLEECIHEWEETDRIDATTTTPGQITYVCQKCGLVETKSIPVKPSYDGTFMNWLGSVMGLFNMTMNEIIGFQAMQFFIGFQLFMVMFSLLAKLIQQGRRGRL